MMLKNYYLIYWKNTTHVEFIKPAGIVRKYYIFKAMRRQIMKKFLCVFPVLLLVCAGMIMMGCSSDPTPGYKVENPDYVLKGGKIQIPFDTPMIEHDKDYEVILTITDCDAGFIGSQLGGKICYKMDMDSTNPSDEKILSGWKNPVPGKYSKNASTYKWTFKAGQKNNDSLEPETDATTPDGATQFFHFEAQTSDWKPYSSKVSFGIKGSLSVTAKDPPPDDWTSEGEVTLGTADGVAGKGTLSSADSTKIREMPAQSKIVITVTVNVGAAGSNSNEPGWGVGAIGGWNNGEWISIDIPAGTPAGEQTFDVSIDISDILTVWPSGDISINLYHGATASKAELFRPTNAAPTTWVSAGEVTLGNTDGYAGKGTFSNEDMAKIDALPANSKIVLTVNTTVNNDSGPKSGWGVANIGGWAENNADSVSIVIPPNTASGPCTFIAEVKI